MARVAFPFPHTLLMALLLIGGTAYAADYSDLKGYWQCQEAGVGYSLEFTSPTRLNYNGEPAAYQLTANMLVVEEEYGQVGYFFQIDGGVLAILSPDGSLSQCRRGSKATPAKPGAPATGGGRGAAGAVLVPGQNWPAYARPSGNVSWSSADPQALLYKFAGRWDRVSSNTLTNLYLKPDGSYEEAYESSYGGSLSGGGSWGAAGSDQARGYWTIQGTLEQGVITLIAANGGQTRLNYRVHVQNGEYYGGEYFFNGQLYSVNYIYR